MCYISARPPLCRNPRTHAEFSSDNVVSFASSCAIEFDKNSNLCLVPDPDSYNFTTSFHFLRWAA